MDIDREKKAIERVFKSKVPPGSIWEHWKSTPDEPKQYLADGFVRSSETKRLEVRYWPLYLSEEYSEGIPWGRDVEEFLQVVDGPNGKVPRYRRVI